MKVLSIIPLLALTSACTSHVGETVLTSESDTGTGPVEGEDTDFDTSGTGDDSESDSETPDAFDLDEYIYSLGHLPLPPEQEPTEQDCEGEQCLEDDPNSEFTCSYTYYNAVDHLEQFVATSPNSNALFAGATVRGDQAKNGLLSLLGKLPRADLTASVSLPNLEGPVDFTYNPQNLSEYRNGLNSVLNSELTGDSPSIMQFQMRRVFSKDDLSLAIGANVEFAGNKVSNLFEFDKSTEKTLLAVSMTEAYFTVDIDTPLSPSGYFEAGVQQEDAEDVMYADNPPMVIPSVTYGRHLLFSGSSNRTEQEMREAFSAVFNFVAKGDTEVSIEHQLVLEAMDIKVLVLGGKNPAQTILGYEGLVDFILDGQGFSENDSGVPIGYKLMHLDGHDMKLALATEYAEAECVPKSVPGSRLWIERLEVPKNGQGIGKGKMIIDIWGQDTGGHKHTFFSTNGGTMKVGDGDIIHIQKHHDFYVDDPVSGADYVQVCFRAQEENKVVESCRETTYNGSTYPSTSGTIWDEDGNLKVGLNFNFSAAP